MGYKAPRTYTITGFCSMTTPVVTTAYYISLGGWNTTTGKAHIPIPISGVIRQIKFYTYSYTTAGSNEAWTVSLNDGTTTTTIATLSLNTNERDFFNPNINYPVTAGGYVIITTTTPNWGTPPVGVLCTIEIIVEYE